MNTNTETNYFAKIKNLIYKYGQCWINYTCNSNNIFEVAYNYVMDQVVYWYPSGSFSNSDLTDEDAKNIYELLLVNLKNKLENKFNDAKQKEEEAAVKYYDFINEYHSELSNL